MKEARSIKFKYLGITYLFCRPVVTRGAVLEIPRKEHGARAEVLSSKLKYAFQRREEIYMTYLLNTAEIRLTGLDDSIRSVVVIRAVAASGDCKEPEVPV